MSSKDAMQGFLFETAPVRGTFVRLKNTYQTIVDQHNYSIEIKKFIGELLVAVSLLASGFKTKPNITLQFQGKKSLKLAIAQCSNELDLRAFVQVIADNEIDIPKEVKSGTLAIIIEPNLKNTERYQAIVPWTGETLVDSIMGYFKQSEQLPTSIWFAEDDDHVCGLLLQIVPDSAENTKNNNEDWNRLNHLTNTLKREEFLNLDNKTILNRLYAEEDVRLFTECPIQFGCKCSLNRSENALRLLSKEEIDEELRDKQIIVVTCEFCNHEYKFDRSTIEKLFKNTKH